jgi:MFS family permease
MLAAKTNWRGIVALNAVSTLSQLGQFGVGFIVLPIWLATRGVGAVELGLFGAVEWTGMLVALILTPMLLKKFMPKQVILFSLALTTIGFVTAIYFTWPMWIISAALVGFAIGLRWIANETWLYRITPKNILGQVVGVHEALIALGAIIPPALVVILTTADNKIILLGILFNLFAAVPLMLIASETRAMSALENSKVLRGKKSNFFNVDHITKLGAYLAGVGGVVDGAIFALFPVFGLGRGFSETQTAFLLTIIGLGALLLQYPLGWLSDQKGVIGTGLLAALVALIVTCMMVFLPINFQAFTILSFLFGGATATFLTFGIIAAASARNHDDMAENMSKIAISFTVCSIVGSLLAGFAVEHLGSEALLWLAALASGALVIVLLQNLPKTSAK